MPATQSFWQLLTSCRVAVPLLQRDYAQGRPDPDATEVRTRFAKALRGAFGPDGRPLNLDFVYGTAAGGVFTPLDGQQRLTTLFLLHWYLATGAAGAGEVLPHEQATLGGFSYEVRAAARDFCAALAACGQRPTGSGPLSEAIAAEGWFRAGWHHDPTVSGMLVMLDELDHRFEDLPAPAAWAALTGAAGPSPLTFQLLDLKVHHLSDDLYTRMNARGKPLTELENWKAWFHDFMAQHYDPARAAAFVEKMEDKWTALFWQNKPASKTSADPALAVDGPLKAYLDFVTRMLWLRTVRGNAKPTDYAAVVTAERYKEVYTERDNLGFLEQSLDALARAGEVGQLAAFFDGLLSAANVGDGRVRAFAGWGAPPKDANCNLFAVCCQQTGTEKLPPTEAAVLFFAVLAYAVRRGGLPEQHNPTDLQDLLRVLRNRMLSDRGRSLFTLSSGVDNERLPRYLHVLDRLLPATGPPQNPYELLAALPPDTAKTLVLEPEQYKAALLLKQPEAERHTWKQALHQLEDNDALRGMLHNLDLAVNAATLRQTAATVTEIWPDDVAHDEEALVVRAGLTVADYSVEVYGGRWFYGGHVGHYHNGWMTVLTEGSATAPPQQVRQWLPEFLESYRQAGGDTRRARLEALIKQYDGTTRCAWPRWRQHFICYPNMVLCPDWQGGRRGYFVRRSGWNMQQLPKKQVNGYHHNPYVRATVLELKKTHLCQENNCLGWGQDGNGPLSYERLGDVADIKLRMTKQGWQLELPDHPAMADLPDLLRHRFEIQEVEERHWHLRQPGEWDLVKTGVAVSEALARVLGSPA